MKWIIGVVIIVAAAGALWWSGLLERWLLPAPAPAPVVENEPPPQNTSGLSTAQNDNSDQALIQDSATIDAEMQALQADTASVDASFSDKPVEQAY